MNWNRLIEHFLILRFNGLFYNDLFYRGKRITKEVLEKLLRKSGGEKLFSFSLKG